MLKLRIVADAVYLGIPLGWVTCLVSNIPFAVAWGAWSAGLYALIADQVDRTNDKKPDGP